MGVLRYRAKRHVIATHSVGTEYSIENAFWQANIKETKQSSKTPMLNGTFEEELDFFSDEYQILTDLVEESELKIWKEFFRSIGVNEEFSIDVSGTMAVPGEAKNCFLTAGGYDPRRHQDGVNLYQFSFTVRIL